MDEAGILAVDHPKAGLGVVLVAPFGQLNKLSSQASWTKNWESLSAPLSSPGTVEDLVLVAICFQLYHPDHPVASVEFNDYSLVDDGSFARASGTKDTPPAPSVAQTKLESTKASNSFSSTLPPVVQYEIPGETIRQPLAKIREHTSFASSIPLPTTSHKLRVLEYYLLFLELIKDPEAIKDKHWLRKLKQSYFIEDISKNPQAPSELDALFTSLAIEQQYRMSKN
ncbi:unnamed protein product [Rhizoctonia solani]|uniref:Uncharacterized protein n=1 Tax=Rhizoctonia solani TaxID=456999 RepID=A0A8H3A0K9_9AGAM|nr:unnamed protein product [Rhizoctonia solani]